MDDLILGPVVDVTISKVTSSAAEQINLGVDWKLELIMLQGKLTKTLAVLQEAGERQVGDPNVKPWLVKLKEVAQEADDILDEVAYESVKQGVRIRHRMKNKVRYFFTLSNRFLFGLRMAHKVKQIIAWMDNVNKEAERFGLGQARLATATAVYSPTMMHPQTDSFLGSVVVGREDDVSGIVQMLTDSTNELSLSFLSIVGLPGSGKTTVAKCVFQNEHIQRYFGKLMWVCVAEDFDVKRILAEMLEALTRSSGVISNQDVIVQKIRDELGENNYLLVLDDLWNEDSEKWNDLESCLLGICKKSGNRVVVTTRTENAALIVGTHPPHMHMHRLGKLKDDDCWSIIKNRAFGNLLEPLELAEIGRDIAKKCDGMPLVATVLGGILNCRRSIPEWLSVKDSIDEFLLDGDQHGIMGVIKLSFVHLPHSPLKRCFAFCSIFPKDFVMEREMLIQLWMAEGFLKSSEESPMTMEDIGNKYFNDLLSYSLLQGDEKDCFGRVTSCKMPNLIHDFARLISQSEIVVLDTFSRSNVSNNVRHLNLICGGEMMPTIVSDVSQKLQTMFSRHGFSHGMSGDFKRLRVLSFCDAADAEDLQTCFGNLKILKYLDISGTQTKELPDLVTKLYSLQTFRFLNCRSLKMPPQGLGNLVNLRHIYFNDENCMPANIGRLTCLQTLPFFFVGTTEGHKIKELGCLRQLRGELVLRNLELVKDKAEAMTAKLDEKSIYLLGLIWGKESNQDQDVLEGLQPHSGLQGLYIIGYGGKNLPSWMLNSNSSLKYESFFALEISRCRRLERIAVMNGFPSLQRLCIWQCNELSSIASGAFATSTSLEELDIEDCPKLGNVPISGLPLLQRLCIKSCNMVSRIGDSLSASSCLKELKLCGLSNLRFIPSLDGLTSLQKIEISRCGQLKCLPSGLSSCTALVELHISSCHNLVSIPEKTLSCLARLKRLHVGDFSGKLEEFPDLSSSHHLHTSLQELHLFDWVNLTQFPQQIQQLTGLGELFISGFHEVEALPEWLENLYSLERLYIANCKILKHLPSVDAIRHLSKLQRLEIWSCPLLETRCTKESGPEWRKISHIPIFINGS